MGATGLSFNAPVLKESSPCMKCPHGFSNTNIDFGTVFEAQVSWSFEVIFTMLKF